MDTLFKPQLSALSRREFLKLTGLSLLSLFWAPPLLPAAHSPASQQPRLGRILNNNQTLFKQPSFNADVIRKLYFDLVIPITGITIGEDYPAYNRVWYQVDEGYVHSGGVQPVEVSPNPIIQTISADGQLAEVTVPYTDALWSIRRASTVAYRFYHNTTHWVMGYDQSKDGKEWYRILDDKWGYTYYVNAAHLRLLPPSETLPISPDVPAAAKRLEIRLEDQVVVAFEDDAPVFMTRAATGARFRDGDYRTPLGVFETNRKRPSRHMAAGEPGIGSGFDLPGVPWVCYLTKSGVSLHGTYWHNDYGKPRSHGCINLSPAAAAWVYRWTLPVVPPGEHTFTEDTGTRVHVV